jgi:DNA-binding response OmpR family regulator
MYMITRSAVSADAPIIAIVDSEAATVDFLTELLIEEGYRVQAYDKEPDVYQALKRDQPALIMLDVRLAPPENGLEMIEHLRLDPATMAIPVIACTADTELIHRHIERLQNLDVVVQAKPFWLGEVLGKIRLALPTQIQLGQQRVPCWI